ncbi:MAG: hypothetical protein Q9195_001879 [Heterodermia aff. obscurata]
MASSGSANPSANQRSISDATGELTPQQIQSLRSEEWTEEHEEELKELKAKLKAAHKSWSAEQELYHGRHEQLEDMKRKAKKAGKKAAKLARKDSGEVKEVTAFHICARDVDSDSEIYRVPAKSETCFVASLLLSPVTGVIPREVDLGRTANRGSLI